MGMHSPIKTNFIQVCDVFYLNPNYEVVALTKKPYEYSQEPPIKGFTIFTTVNIFEKNSTHKCRYKIFYYSLMSIHPIPTMLFYCKLFETLLTLHWHM